MNYKNILSHYENLQAIDFTEDLIKQKRIELSDNEFLTMEDENYYSVKKEL